MKVVNRYVNIRVTEDGDVNAVFGSVASTNDPNSEQEDRSAIGVVEIELPKAFVKELQNLIGEYKDQVDGKAIADLYESLRVDGPPEAGRKAVKIERSLSLAGNSAPEHKPS